MARDKIGADAQVGGIEDRVGQVREVFGNIRKRGYAEDVAEHDAQHLSPPETRQGHRRRHAGAILAQKLEEPLLVLFHAEHAVKAAGVGYLEKALRVLENGVGEKPAIRENSDGAAQGGRRADDAVEDRAGFQPQALQVQQGAVGIGYGGKQQPDTRGNTFRQSYFQAGGVEQTGHQSG